MAEDGNAEAKSPAELAEEERRRKSVEEKPRKRLVEDKNETMGDWWKIIVTAIVTFIVTSLASFAATYYTHGVALATVQQRLATAEEKIKTLENKTPPTPMPVPNGTPILTPTPKGEPEAKIEITNLVKDAEVDVTSSGNPGNLASFYTVRGTSVNVVASDSLRWSVWVRPIADNVWYLQDDEASINENTGEWQVKAWIGDEKKAPKAGEKFDVAALVTDPAVSEGKDKVRNLRELRPKAQSIVTGLRVGNIQ